MTLEDFVYPKKYDEYSENQLVRNYALNHTALISFLDHTGQVKNYRFYRWLGKIGITDAFAKKVIIPAYFHHVEVNTSYEVIIGTNNLFGTRLYPFANSTLGKSICASAPDIFPNMDTAKEWLANISCKREFSYNFSN